MEEKKKSSGNSASGTLMENFFFSFLVTYHRKNGQKTCSRWPHSAETKRMFVSWLMWLILYFASPAGSTLLARYLRFRLSLASVDVTFSLRSLQEHWWTLLHSNSCFLHICSRTEGKERKRKICGTNGLLLLLWLLWLKELIFFPKLHIFFPFMSYLFYGLNFSESETPLIHLKNHRDSWRVIKPLHLGTRYNDAGPRCDTFTLLVTQIPECTFENEIWYAN